MKIGILVTSIGDAGQKGFYNVQEIGLARAMNQIADEVVVYKLVSIHLKESVEQIEGCCNAYVKMVPSYSLGTNGVFDVSILSSSLDALIYFSDMQLMVPWVYRWSVKNQVLFLPYIGVAQSHSTNMVKRKLMNLSFKWVVRIYSKNSCLAKTPRVADELRSLGIKNITVMSIGLDTYITDHEYSRYSKLELKREYGYAAEDKIILFVGRLTEEKQPIRMVELYNKLRRKNDSYRLVMIGTGSLKEKVELSIREHGLCDCVKLIDKIENRKMCKLYRLADVLVNLNQREIFGMTILEAMFYECKVVAWNAPGPELLIENGLSGWIVQSEEETIEKILDERELGRNAHDRIEKEFTWNKTAKRIVEMIRDGL